MATMNHGAGCWCFDLCSDAPARDFLQSTQGCSISRSGPWHRYLSAVYAGRAPFPFDLGQLSFFYSNSPPWRARFHKEPSPFRDCARLIAQPQCPASICSPWRKALAGCTRRSARPVALLPNVTSFIWGYGGDTNLRGASIFSDSKPDASRVESRGPHGYMIGTRLTATTWRHGRDMQPDNVWVEVMRKNHRPLGFHEAMQPPNCSRARPQRNATRNATRSGKHAAFTGCDWEHYPAGCWMRPAKGSGVWLNTGRTRQQFKFPEKTSEVQIAVYNAAAAGGLDTIQYAFGDAWVMQKTEFPPLLVRTGADCFGRSKGLITCLSAHTLRAGWHDLPCKCDEEMNIMNCLGDKTKRRTGVSPPPAA